MSARKKPRRKPAEPPRVSVDPAHLETLLARVDRSALAAMTKLAAKGDTRFALHTDPLEELAEIAYVVSVVRKCLAIASRAP